MHHRSLNIPTPRRKSRMLSGASFTIAGFLLLAPLIGATTQPATRPAITADERTRWVGQFDQCSYNAIASALQPTAGSPPAFTDRKAFEDDTFVKPLDAVGTGAYYGWGPWTADMINSGKMTWAAKPLAGYHAERFSLATADLPTIDGYHAVVHYRPGERQRLHDLLVEKLALGPVIIWTPYAGVLSQMLHDPNPAWQHVSREGDVDRVLFHPNMTHSITIFQRAGSPDEVLLTDCSKRNGIFIVPIDTIVSTAAAMSASVRVADENGSSVFSRGLKGVTNDEFEVVLKKVDVATTAPATQANADDHSEQQLGFGNGLTSAWSTGLKSIPPDHRAAAEYVIYHMPQRDREGVAVQLVTDRVSAAYAAFDASPWHADVPQDVFQQAVLPYANLDEKREDWDATLAPVARPLIANCKTPGEAAVSINNGLFDALHVKYHPTLRPKPNQSPSESIAAGYASCTGLSVLLVDACRSVGVPARIVGTPGWVVPKGDENGNHAGNHTWVQVWSEGSWHSLGASEKSPLDQCWFIDNAKLCATSDDPMHHIYAAVWGGKAVWPMVWDLEDKSVGAEDVTNQYAN